MKCPLCETPVAEGDSFCEACGHPLTAPDCESCGAAAVDAEGYCERCGVRQSTGMDHAEAVLDGSGAAAVTDRGLRRARNEDAVTLTTLNPPSATTPPPVPNPTPHDAGAHPYGPGTAPQDTGTVPYSTEPPHTPDDAPEGTGAHAHGTGVPRTPDGGPNAAGAHAHGTGVPRIPDGGPDGAGAHSYGAGVSRIPGIGPDVSGAVPDDAGTVPVGGGGFRSAGGVVVVVCDGVGSSPRADEAAAAAVAAAGAALADGRAHEEAFALAGHAVGKLAASPDDAPACTYVAAVARPGEVTICWAGDSRAYWLADTTEPGGGVRRHGTLLTEDDAAPTGEITAWLGADYPDVRPRIRVFTPPGPGLLLVCSDGLWRYLAGYRFPTAGTPLDQARQMLRYALDSGGHDNVTIALIPLGGTHG